MASIPDLLAFVEERTDLDLVAITDQDDIGAAHRAREAAVAQGRRFEVIVGMEVTTIEGHLLALFVENPVPSMRSLAKTVEAVQRQGGVCVVPHPFSWLTRSIGENGLNRLHRGRADGPWVDGIEIANESPAGRVTRKRSRALNRERFGLAEVGGSDAHFLQAVGTSYTTFPGSSAEDLREAIVSRTTSGHGGPHPRLAEIGYRRLVYQQVRSWTVTPRRVVGRPLLGLFRRLGTG